MTKARNAATAAIERIAARDPELRAWVHHDPARLLRQADEIDLSGGDAPLAGLTVGLKDIFDTADMPTEYGSPIYRGHRPPQDAEVVRRLRAAGALIVGKTATTEFAYAHPAATVNPHDPLHTPGGSSSGSAAAVAAGMVRMALGSQTGGSTIRPSAYCGIVGFKPTHGLVPTAGMKPLAPSLDTVGLHARSVGDIRRLLAVLTGGDAREVSAPSRIHFFPGPFADQADDDARGALHAARDLLKDAGFGVQLADFGGDFARLGDAQLTIMAREASASLRPEYETQRGALSPEMLALIAKGLASTDAQCDDARRLAARCRAELSATLDRGGVILTFSAPGEAPLLTAGTGNSVFNRVWTLLGAPAITLPFGQGRQGLPLGVQLVAAPGCDDELLACAQSVEAAFARIHIL